MAQDVAFVVLLLLCCPFLAAQSTGPEPAAVTYARLAEAPGSERPFALAQRALWAFEQGLEEHAWSDLGRLRERGVRPAGFERLEEAAVDRLLARAGVGPVREKARRLLDRAAALRPDSTDPAAQAQRSLLPVALVRLAARASAEEGPAGAERLQVLLKDQAEKGLGAERRRCARLALLGAEAPARGFVYRMALRYPAGSTRSRIVEEIRHAGRAAEASLEAVRCLEEGDAAWRLRAVEVLAVLPCAAALSALHEARSTLAGQRRAALAGARGGAPGSRAHVAFLTQQAFVRDFDVEVASSAYIADPVVDALSWGTLLDVTLVSVQIHRFFLTYHRALDRAIQACSVADGG